MPTSVNLFSEAGNFKGLPPKIGPYLPAQEKPISAFLSGSYISGTSLVNPSLTLPAPHHFPSRLPLSSLTPRCHISLTPSA
jgi:hypothetical protein